MPGPTTGPRHGGWEALFYREFQMLVMDSSHEQRKLFLLLNRTQRDYIVTVPNSKLYAFHKDIKI
jgi:hypothetical protein